VLSAIISENGEVTDLKAVGGPPLLYPAALEAVRQWKFEPTYLNGRPWPVAHEITVHFRL
jgi:outer membrane biosynthesis protein TonB